MPSLAAAVRGAGARDFSADPHHGGPCDCKGAAALLRHRSLPYPDQSRYGPVPASPIKWNRKPRVVSTPEGGGQVGTCLGCGWSLWVTSPADVKRCREHECPKPPRRKRK